MTPRQADKIIKAGVPVQVRDSYGETFTLFPKRRDRWNIYGVVKGSTFESVFDRGDLKLAR